jgi:flagellar basal-body rod modification protein FlgD
MNENQFLQLLTAQLKNQDPLDPVSSTDFATQLAQFSTLQGVQQLNASFSDMLTLQQMTQGANLVGRSVAFQQAGSSTPQQGTVQGVSVQNGQLQLLIGGAAVPLTQVLSVQQPTTGNS